MYTWGLGDGGLFNLMEDAGDGIFTDFLEGDCTMLFGIVTIGNPDLGQIPTQSAWLMVAL